VIQVPVELADLHGAVVGSTVDVSRGGLLASTPAPKSIGTLLRVRVLGPTHEAVMAVGVVVRSLPGQRRDPGESGKGVAIALTSTSEAWDRFWDDVAGPGDRTGSA